MSLVELMNSIWVPVAFMAACLVYGIYMLITKDPGKVRRRDDNRHLNDPEKYAKNAGYLMLFMALGCLVMIGIIQILKNDVAATIQSLIWFVVFAVLWRRNDKINGAV